MSHLVVPPIIIIGMHRSGTSMIARLLEGLGLYIGRRKNSNHEAMFFYSLNDWLLRQSGGAWDHPEPFNDLLGSSQVRALVVDYLRRIVASPHVIGYLGLTNYLRYRSLQRFPIPWGWKDPRNTFTLPLWLELFPGSRVIHIYRHGVDVAASLRAREQMRLLQVEAHHTRCRRWHLYWLYRRRFRHTVPVKGLSLKAAFCLWETYLDQAREHVLRLGDRTLELRYEDFLLEPDHSLQLLVTFCDLAVTKAQLEKTAQRIRTERAYAYRQQPELREFARTVAERLAIRGYPVIPDSGHPPDSGQ